MLGEILRLWPPHSHQIIKQGFTWEANINLLGNNRSLHAIIIKIPDSWHVSTTAAEMWKVCPEGRRSALRAVWISLIGVCSKRAAHRDDTDGAFQNSTTTNTGIWQVITHRLLICMSLTVFKNTFVEVKARFTVNTWKNDTKTEISYAKTFRTDHCNILTHLFYNKYIFNKNRMNMGRGVCLTCLVLFLNNDNTPHPKNGRSN